MENVSKIGHDVFNILRNEEYRQRNTVELIASENFVSDDILRALGSVFTNKYTEGYPAERYDGMGNSGRYYGGCQYYDQLENLCVKRWKQVFRCEDTYHVNVQPHSGTQANMEAYASVLNIGDRVLAMDIQSGAHLSHGSKASSTSKLYEFDYYGLDENGYIDLNQIFTKLRLFRPKLVVVGASAYSREIPFGEICEMCHDEGALVLTDIAHIAGLVATGFHESPFSLNEYGADLITTTAHKTLRGPRGGLIFSKPELAKKVDSAVFPKNQGGSLMNVIAAKAICAEEALSYSYHDYIEQVVKNAKAMADEFIKMGYKVVSGGTDNHLFLLDLNGIGVTGVEVQEACDENDITLNKNSIPNDPLPPSKTSGVRIGTSAMTTKGYKEGDFIIMAHRIDSIIKQIQDNHNKNKSSIIVG